MAFVNGRVFDGEQFTERPLYVRNGVFVAERPASVDTTIDLGGQYVVPPYADAHVHHVADAWIHQRAARAFVEEGTFYVQALTNPKSEAQKTRDYFLSPETIDVSLAHGGLTSTLGHPFLAYEPRAMGLRDPSTWSEKRDSIAQSRIRNEDAYWFVDSMADLDAVWPQYTEDYPDVVKIYLLGAESHPDTVTVDDMGRIGLDPAIVPKIVQRAHAEGLRVFSHVETADDVRIAVEAGVDGIAHLPGYGLDANADRSTFRIADDVIEQMARRGVVVTTTTLISTAQVSDSTRLARIQDLQAEHLRRMKAAGVPVAVGCDWYGRPAFPEVENLAGLDVYSLAELLDVWSRATPQAVFPQRRIGRLAPGYEASLLVLEDDPLDAVEHFQSITLRMKQGRLL